MDKFRNAFDGKWLLLSKRLDVSYDLLVRLFDLRVLDSSHFQDLKAMKNEPNYKKVDKLLEKLVLRDDSLFDVFCDALKAEKQFDVVEIILSQLNPSLDFLCTGGLA